MIRSFRDAEAEEVFQDRFSKRFQSIERTARRKLYQINQARTLRDLMLPGNGLEALQRDRAGNTAFGSTTSSGSVSCGATATRMRSKSSTTIETNGRTYG